MAVELTTYRVLEQELHQFVCFQLLRIFTIGPYNKGRLGLRLAHKSSSILDYIHENHDIAITRSSSSCADPRLKVAFKYLNQCHCPGWGFKYLKYYHGTAIIRLHHIKSDSHSL